MTTTQQEAATMTSAQELFAESVMMTLCIDCNNWDYHELTDNDHPGISFEIDGADRDYAFEPATVMAEVKTHTDIERYSLQCVPYECEAPNYKAAYILPEQNAVMLLEGAPGEFTDDNYDLYLFGSIRFFDSIEDARQFAKQQATKVAVEVAKTMFSAVQSEFEAIPAGQRDEAGKAIQDLLAKLPKSIAGIEAIPAHAVKK